MDYIITPFDGATAGDHELRDHYALSMTARSELYPGFSQPSFEQHTRDMRRARNEYGPRRIWSAYTPDGELAGSAQVVYMDQEHTDAATIRMNVAAAHRRRGLGTALLRTLVAEAGSAGRSRLVDEQVVIGSPGEHWARAIGFVEVLRNCWQMLYVQQADRERWEVPVPEGFRIEHWMGAAPERLVAAFAAARNAMTDAPTGDSSYRPAPWTVERVRENEARLAEAGEQLWFAVAVPEASGEIAALTGLVVDPQNLEMSWQRDTAVVRAHRGRGLGRAVKAAMMRALIAEHPGLQRVVTSTAAQNTAMRRVNEQIGYVRYADIGMYEAEVADLAARLAGEGAAVGAVPAGDRLSPGIVPAQRGETKPAAADSQP